MSIVQGSETIEEKPAVTNEPRPRGTYGSDARLRKFASWSAVLGAMALVSYFAIFMALETVDPSNPESSWIIRQFERNFAATLAIPLSAVAAFCIVTLLRATTGPIEIEAQGIKFEGASGPIIFWILCFSAIVLAVKLLWVP